MLFYLDRNENKVLEELKRTKELYEDLQQRLMKNESDDSSEIEKLKTEFARVHEDLERLQKETDYAKACTSTWQIRYEQSQLKYKELEAQLTVRAEFGGMWIFVGGDNQVSSAQNLAENGAGDPDTITFQVHELDLRSPVVTARQEGRQTADIEPGAGYNGSINSEEDEDVWLADNGIVMNTEPLREEMGKGGSNVGYESRKTNEREEKSKSLPTDCVEGQVGSKNQATNKGDIQAEKNENLNEYSKPDKKKGGGSTKKQGRREQIQMKAERKRNRKEKEKEKKGRAVIVN